MERLTGVSHGSISRLETGSAPVNLASVGKILDFFGRDSAEAFPEGKDGADQLVPVSDFGSWLRNFRVRKGLQQAELAEILGIHRVSVCRYERNNARPHAVIIQRLKKAFKLDGELDRFLLKRNRPHRPSINR